MARNPQLVQPDTSGKAGERGAGEEERAERGIESETAIEEHAARASCEEDVMSLRLVGLGLGGPKR
jgi:hypothetical protein